MAVVRLSSHSHFLGWESSPCVVLLLLSPMSTLETIKRAQ